MHTNTKSLFVSILKAGRADCVCDIGSRDGDQSLLFRQVLPEALVFAFEANPINFNAMQTRQALKDHHISMFPFAISDQSGTAAFHIADVDYTAADANRGTSSLLRSEGEKIKETVKVPTVRIDDFLLEHSPGACRIALWIDVEGAEGKVLDGFNGIAERIVAIHVETANEPRWQGQRPFRDIEAQLMQNGFVCYAVNFGNGPREWGDALFVRQNVIQGLGSRLTICTFKAFMSYALRADDVAVFLKRHAYWLYRSLRWLYLKLGT